METLKKYYDLRDQLYDKVKEPYQKKTPTEYIEKRDDGYEYAEYAYMLDEMNRQHPIRSEDVIFESLIEKFAVFTCTIRVIDLQTGEARCGSGAHPVAAFEAGTDKLKSLKSIANLMENAKKSALSKALRNAWSNFGIASDLYRAQLKPSPTKEQIEAFNDAVQLNDIEGLDFDKVEKLAQWIVKQKVIFLKCDPSTADDFKDKMVLIIKEQLTKLRGSK